MKGGVRKKSYFMLVMSNFITLPLIGWYVYGILTALVGLGIAIIIDRFFPTWEYELSWKDIERALRNLYKYGRNPSQLWFRVGNRKILIYRDENGGEKKPIRMAVSIPTADWADLLDQEDYHGLVSKYGGKGIPSNIKGKEYYDIFTKIDREGPDDCKEILRVLFQKAAGGLSPEIMAQSVINTEKIIWLDHE